MKNELAQIKYRKARVSDFAAIRDLLIASDLLKKKWVGNSFTPQLFRKILKRNAGCFWVATSGKEIVGNVWGSHDGGFNGYIYKLAVAAHMRRNGIAEELVSRVIGEFKKEKILWFFCFIRFDNKASLRLFKQKGFQPLKNYNCYDFVP
jgi:ribosomal protein S18 acetylase RimI-like enzyme